MTNEIKEILDYLKDDSMFIYDEDGTRKEITLDESKLLLDYITNLQEESKEWEMIFDTFSRRPCAHRYLKEKRKELNNDNIVGLDSESIYKDYYNLKDRIDKAVEYIDEHTIHDTPKKLKNGIYEQGQLIRTCSFYIEDLLDILRGDE